MGGTGGLALRQGPWKYIPDLSVADGWKSATGKPGGKASGEGLYNLADDPAESKNLHSAKPEVSKRLAGVLREAVTPRETRPVSR